MVSSIYRGCLFVRPDVFFEVENYAPPAKAVGYF